MLQRGLLVDIEAARRIQHGFDARDQPRRWAPLRGIFERCAGVELLVAKHLCWQLGESFGRNIERQVHRPAILFFPRLAAGILSQNGYGLSVSKINLALDGLIDVPFLS